VVVISLITVLFIDFAGLSVTSATTTNLVLPAAIKTLCSYNHHDLPSIIWSHRAHHSSHQIDGSKLALGALLQAGIRNFDVDVSCKAESIGSPCEYIIAHPSVLSINEGNIDHNMQLQTVEAFLGQVFTHCQGKNELSKLPPTTARLLLPLITLEMKFSEPERQIAFVQHVQKLPLADHVAIIGTNPRMFVSLVPHLTHSGLAAAYRSKPLSTQDFTWPNSSAMEWKVAVDGHISAFFSLVPPPLIIIGRSKINVTDATGLPENTEQIATLVAGSQTIEVDNQRQSGKPFLQVYMPDVKLLKNRLHWRMTQDESSQRMEQKLPTPMLPQENVELKARRDSLVVTWVVDSEAEMWTSLANKVDGVISNRPVPLLEALLHAHKLYC
jgi:hypothetical protein